MKIALCLHGLFNSAQDKTSLGHDGYLYIKKHILDKYDTDVFIHTWECDKADLINHLYNPVAAVYQPQIDFSDIIEAGQVNTLTGFPRSPQSVLSHIYSVTECLRLPFKTSTTYDVIIKSRFDLGRINRNTSGPGLPNPYPVQCINLQPNVEPTKIYMANWNHFYMGPADMWFYGSPHVMVKFGNLYSVLKSQMHIDSDFHKFAKSITDNDGDLSNSIAFYKWWMIENELWYNRVNLDSIWE